MTDQDVISTDDLIALGREVINTLDRDTDSITVRTNRLVNMAHGPAIFALSQHGLRLGTVALDLHQRGLRLEAMPTVRTLYESAITAQWLAQSREAINAWMNEDFRGRRALSRTLADCVSTTFNQGATRIAHLNESDLETIARSQAQNFEQRCKALTPGGADAYALYRAMSWFCHPTPGLTDHYLHDDDNPSGIVFLTEPDQIHHDAFLHLCVASLVWSGRALDVMREGSPHREFLRRVARRIGTADMLQLTPETRAAEDAAEKARRHAGWKGPRRKGTSS